MSEQAWWQGTMRVIQDNLQVADTPLMDAQKIARETEEMHANVLVVNVGGIYAWYPSDVPYHHVNEYLPKDRDLFGELVDACHARGIKLVARFDFSKTHDYVAQHHPEWFVREPDGRLRPYGQTRPGNWSILYATCINSGYRNEEVAVPAIREVVERYPIDGIFFNAPNYEYCCCEVCQAKYKKLYGKELPMDNSGANENVSFGHKSAPEETDKRFPGQCYTDNIGVLYKTIKDAAPEIPLILYYGIDNENLTDRLKTTDMLCTEAQNVLSRGWRNIPPIWLPTIIMKMGRATPEGNPAPFGIIHSCPGMDWRHTGLPQAEYKFWLRQVPAAGGTIWHSITGFNDTVTDKRIIDAVTDVNEEISHIEDDMLGAKERADMLLLWNSEKTHGWAGLLVDTQTQFDIRDPYLITPALLKRYPVVVLPDGYDLTEAIADMLRGYVKAGGKLITESTGAKNLEMLADVLGIVPGSVRSSENMTASYFQFEPAGDALRKGFERMQYLPHRGITAYAKPAEGTQTLATLVPPFAPLNAVGSPPERASILVKHTDIPLLTQNKFGKGVAVMIPFGLSALVEAYHLVEHEQLFENVLDSLLGDERKFSMTRVRGVVANVYEKKDLLLVHLVNGVGQRPLANSIPVPNIELKLRIPKGKKVKAVNSKLEHIDLSYEVSGDTLAIKLPMLKLWDMIAVELV